MRTNPPPSAGEGGPCVSRGRERGSATLVQGAPVGTVPPHPEAWFPSPGLLRRPSPAEGRVQAHSRRSGLSAASCFVPWSFRAPLSGPGATLKPSLPSIAPIDHTRTRHGEGFLQARALARLRRQRRRRDVASALDAGRHRGAAFRRQRGRCRHRRGGGAMRGRSADDRHRRRLLRPLRTEGRDGADRAQRLGPQPGRGAGCLVPGARHHPDPDLAPCRDGARRGRRLGQAPSGSRHPQPRRTLATRDPLRRGRLPGAAAGRPRLVAQRRAGRRRPGLGRDLPDRRTGPDRRHDHAPSEARRHAQAHRARRPARLLRGAGGRGHRRAPARSRRVAHAGRFRHGGAGDRDPGHHPLSRLRRLRMPAERPGPRGADDAQRAVALRHRGVVGTRPGPPLREACKQAYHHRDALFADPVLNRVPVEHLLSKPGGRAPTAPSTWAAPRSR